jgi:hypothetical protein
MKEVQCELQQYPNSVEMVRSEAEAVRVYTTLRRDEESFFKAPGVEFNGGICGTKTQSSFFKRREYKKFTFLIT